MAKTDEDDGLVTRLRQELEDYRSALDAARDQHWRDLAAVAAERDEAAERAEDLELKVAEANRTIDELTHLVEELRTDADVLSSERDEAMAEARNVEAVIAEAHQETIAKMLEAHEREIVKFADAAAKAAGELVAERRMLDQLLAESNVEVDRLLRERDSARAQVNELSDARKAAAVEIDRVSREFEALEKQRDKQRAKLAEREDKFIEEILQDHERELALLAKQRDEVMTQRDSVEALVVQATREAEQAVQALKNERKNFAKLAHNRESTALELDRLAAEREAATRSEAQQRAEADRLVAEVLKNHERELASAYRQRDFVQERLADAERDIGELKGTIARLVADRDDDHEQERATSVQKMKSAERDIAELKTTIARLVSERADDPDTEMARLYSERQAAVEQAQRAEEYVAELKATITRLLAKRES
ncbi:MAG TPA: hypothetical protein VFB62_13735 [Polyangiaceae bacterium]|jgi:chromosome segregation ATPase|nr:hypothetical protein [Polyangiaceae bacterium]